jgi:hypothetical protein
MKVGELWIGVLGAAAVVAGVVVFANRGDAPASVLPPSVARASQEPGPGDMVVYKSPTCGCCGLWVDHMRAAGFTVIERDTSDVGAVKDRLGVLPSLGSCHTAIVAGYVVEGHVPADDVIRLLEERPAIVGIAVPGMPAGSPGMESARPFVPYDVIAFDKNGRTNVFSRH